MKKIAVVTVGRSDYSLYLPILRRISSHPGLKLQLIVSGTHLAAEYGRTVEGIEADGFEICERVEMLLNSSSAEGVAKSMGLATIGYAQALARQKPDWLLVLGDRFEMHAAAVAAVPFRLPIAHIHGGELTLGAIDDALRHSMTKLSHLHFVTTPEYARRVEQMGEEPWRITISGAPSLDNLPTVPRLPSAEFFARFGLEPREDFLLVTQHPTTLEENSLEQFDALAGALKALHRPILFTMPNADAGGHRIREKIRAYVQAEPSAQVVENLGTQGYYSAMGLALAMAGNSSSGIIEAASFSLPVVNVGSRQEGRIRGHNVIDVPAERKAIQGALEQAVSPEFRRSLHGLRNPYGDGQAADRIVNRLHAQEVDGRLLLKRFHTVPADSIS